MKIEIKNRWSGEVIFAHEAENNSWKITVEAAIGVDADLSDADLSCADLSRADLSDADLSCADLSRANLSDADLSRANLSDADLSRANLSDADLSCANLSRANLSDADLSDADLSCADLSRANLSDADLSRANLSDADLSCANLSDADLSCAKVDFSSGWRFACSCSRFKISVKFAYQVLAHLCSCKSDDLEFTEVREKMLPYAKKSHRARDLGLLDGEAAVK